MDVDKYGRSERRVLAVLIEYSVPFTPPNTGFGFRCLVWVGPSSATLIKHIRFPLGFHTVLEYSKDLVPVPFHELCGT